MNYLAHFHLSYGDDDLLLGALLGDFVKGPLKGEFRSGLEQGIWLHRKIDAFTDGHEHLRDLRQLFTPHFQRYSGIMLDVVFDHFLSEHWRKFHHQPLPEFSAGIYRLLTEQSIPLTRAQQQARHLVRFDVLTSYSQWNTVDAALRRIGQRLTRSNPLAEAAEELKKKYQLLEYGFLEFYPQLIAHCEKLRSDSYASVEQ